MRHLLGPCLLVGVVRGFLALWGRCKVFALTEVADYVTWRWADKGRVLDTSVYEVQFEGSMRSNIPHAYLEHRYTVQMSAAGQSA